MNWGYKILVAYALFVAGIVFLVVKSTMQNQDLVTRDYYEQELKYQDRIDETERANALSAAVSYELKQDKVVISLPAEMSGKKITASVLLYCAADKMKDVRKDLHTENAVMHFTIPPVNKGMHELKLSWMADGKVYYNQHKLFIQ